MLISRTTQDDIHACCVRVVGDDDTVCETFMKSKNFVCLALAMASRFPQPKELVPLFEENEYRVYVNF